NPCARVPLAPPSRYSSRRGMSHRILSAGRTVGVALLAALASRCSSDEHPVQSLEGSGGGALVDAATGGGASVDAADAAAGGSGGSGGTRGSGGLSENDAAPLPGHDASLRDAGSDAPAQGDAGDAAHDSGHASRDTGIPTDANDMCLYGFTAV